MMINEKLIEWYRENKRDLPWRNSKDPYCIWVSEIMLQQTRVEAVKPYYARFINRLSTIEDLSYCKEDELIKLWEGLGYYSRVRNMQKAARTCMEKYEGKLPDNYDALIQLSGIGPYSAAAISSIAFKENKVAIDGNVMRVFARLLCIEEDISTKSAQAQIQAYFQENPYEDMGEMNQAIMDFASAICLPKTSVRCNICPLKEECKAYQMHKEMHLPIKKKKKDRRKEKHTVLMYVCKNKVLLHKRSSKGLLAGLYEFTTVENHKTKKELPKSLYLGKYKHIFSHVEWDMKGFLIVCEEMFESDGIWVEIEDMIRNYSIPSAFSYYRTKLLEYYAQTK